MGIKKNEIRNTVMSYDYDNNNYNERRFQLEQCDRDIKDFFNQDIRMFPDYLPTLIQLNRTFLKLNESIEQLIDNKVEKIIIKTVKKAIESGQLSSDILL